MDSFASGLFDALPIATGSTSMQGSVNGDLSSLEQLPLELLEKISYSLELSDILNCFILSKTCYYKLACNGARERLRTSAPGFLEADPDNDIRTLFLDMSRKYAQPYGRRSKWSSTFIPFKGKKGRNRDGGATVGYFSYLYTSGKLVWQTNCSGFILDDLHNGTWQYIDFPSDWPGARADLPDRYRLEALSSKLVVVWMQPRIIQGLPCPRVSDFCIYNMETEQMRKFALPKWHVPIIASEDSVYLVMDPEQVVVQPWDEPSYELDTQLNVDPFRRCPSEELQKLTPLVLFHPQCSKTVFLAWEIRYPRKEQGGEEEEEEEEEEDDGLPPSDFYAYVPPQYAVPRKDTTSDDDGAQTINRPEPDGFFIVVKYHAGKRVAQFHQYIVRRDLNESLQTIPTRNHSTNPSFSEKMNSHGLCELLEFHSLAPPSDEDGSRSPLQRARHLCFNTYTECFYQTEYNWSDPCLESNALGGEMAGVRVWNGQCYGVIGPDFFSKSNTWVSTAACSPLARADVEMESIACENPKHLRGLSQVRHGLSLRLRQGIHVDDEYVITPEKLGYRVLSRKESRMSGLRFVPGPESRQIVDEQGNVHVFDVPEGRVRDMLDE